MTSSKSSPTGQPNPRPSFARPDAGPSSSTTSERPRNSSSWSRHSIIGDRGKQPTTADATTAGAPSPASRTEMRSLAQLQPSRSLPGTNTTELVSSTAEVDDAAFGRIWVLPVKYVWRTSLVPPRPVLLLASKPRFKATHLPVAPLRTLGEISLS